MSDWVKQQVMRLWNAGYSMRYIALRIGVPRATVSSYLTMLRHQGYPLMTHPRGLTPILRRRQMMKLFAENSLLLYWNDKRPTSTAPSLVQGD